MGKICTFAGHGDRAYSVEEKERLYDACGKLVEENGITEFWVGNYGAFDHAAAAAVQRLKSSFPVELDLVLPYMTREIEGNLEAYRQAFDNILIAEIPLNVPKRLYIVHCCHYMADKAAVMVAYISRSYGGAIRTVRYAKSRGVPVVNLGELDISLI